ncbi:DUF3221 domain-containing protein [Sporosalibacterium faouarense]|uniref:DUF3221 domain-containing protein n=1 Tax=Sporosalibacterium faouarense TaxID=516123 RepID=UPI00141CB990|nr:DUF3221 domain-containing protein [Sporosalibacterium faouarense]MTI49167.1 DUF3221 domain-containing protein [Bacillota bacterium]
MTKKIIVICILYSLLTISFIGCNTDPNSDINTGDTDTLGAKGKITEVYFNDDDVLISILVDGEDEAKNNSNLYGKARVEISQDTSILKDDEKVSIESLKKGQKVGIVFDGAVAESYPVQGTAKKILILE